MFREPPSPKSKLCGAALSMLSSRPALSRESGEASVAARAFGLHPFHLCEVAESAPHRGKPNALRRKRRPKATPSCKDPETGGQWRQAFSASAAAARWDNRSRVELFQIALQARNPMRVIVVSDAENKKITRGVSPQRLHL